MTGRIRRWFREPQRFNEIDCFDLTKEGRKIILYLQAIGYRGKDVREH